MIRSRLSLSKNLPAEDFGGKKSVKGNRQGFLSRSITRRSGQNCKIILHFYILQFCRQLVKKVQWDFFDKLRRLRNDPEPPSRLFQASIAVSVAKK